MLRVIPAAQNAKLIPAQHIAGQGIPNDDRLMAFTISDPVPYKLKKLSAWFFEADLI